MSKPREMVHCSHTARKRQTKSVVFTAVPDLTFIIYIFYCRRSITTRGPRALHRFPLRWKPSLRVVLSFWMTVAVPYFTGLTVMSLFVCFSLKRILTKGS